MIGTAMRALLAERAAWWAPALVSALVSVMIGVCAVQALGTDATHPAIREVLRREGLTPSYVSSVGTGIAVMAVPVAVIVLAVVSTSAIRGTIRDLARWRLAGAAAPLLSALVLGRLLLAVLLGALLGTAATALLGGPLAELLNAAILPELRGLPVRPAPTALLAATLVPPTTALLSGLPAALRGARVPALRAVRHDPAPEGKRRRRDLVGVVLGVGAVLGVAVILFRDPPDMREGEVLTAGLGLLVLMLAAAGIGASVLVPAAVSMLGALVPVPGALRRLARDAAAARARSSGGAVVALACGTGLLGAISGMARTSEAIARAAGSTEEYNLVDTYVICGIIGLLSAVGGACVIALDAGDRRREVAQLRIAGMTPRQVLWSAVLEAGLLTGAVLLLTLLATGLSTGLVVRAADAAALSARLVLPWAEMVVSGAGTLVVLALALAIPSAHALQVPLRSSLAAE